MVFNYVGITETEGGTTSSEVYHAIADFNPVGYTRKCGGQVLLLFEIRRWEHQKGGVETTDRCVCV